MRKNTKIWRKVLWASLTGMLLLVVVPPLALRIPYVQNKVKDYAVHLLSESLDTRVKIGEVRLRWFLNLSALDIQVDDRQGRALLRVVEARVNVSRLRWRDKEMTVQELRLLEPAFNLYVDKDSSASNLQFILDHFASEDTSASAPWAISVVSLEITNGAFIYSNFNKAQLNQGIDWDYLNVDSLQLQLKEYRQRGDTQFFRMEHLALKEVSGFSLDTLQADFALGMDFIDATGLRIINSRTDLDLDLRFQFPGFSAFNHFIDSVYLDGTIRGASLDMAEIGYFAPELLRMHNRVKLSGNLKGYVSAFRARNLELRFGEAAYLSANLDVNGLPAVEETFVDARIHRLELQASDIEGFALPEGERIGTLPELVTNLGQTRVEGTFTGFYNDFVVQADIASLPGTLNADLVLRRDRSGGGMSYRGHISSGTFDAGYLLDARPVVGSMQLALEVEGQGMDWSGLNLRMEGVVDSLELQGETFARIGVNGLLEGKQFTGMLQVDDDLLGLDFNGQVDFGGEQPRFDVRALVHHARLDILSGNSYDKYLLASGDAMLNFSGDRLDQLEGTIGIERLELRDSTHRFTSRSFLLSFEPDEYRYKAVRLRSDFADVDIEGSFLFGQLFNALTHKLHDLLPSAGWDSPAPPLDTTQFARLDLNLYETDLLSEIFAPYLRIEFGTRLQAELSKGSQEISWELKSSALSYEGFGLKDVDTKGRWLGNWMDVSLEGKEFLVGDSVLLVQPVVEVDLLEDSSAFTFRWKDLDDGDEGYIRGFASLVDRAKLQLRLSESRLPIDTLVWAFNTDHTILIDSGGIDLNNVMLTQGLQMLRLNGRADKDLNSQLGLQFNHFDIGMAHLLLDRYGLSLGGIMDGDITLMSVLATPRAYSSLNIRKFSFNGDLLGDAGVNASWEPEYRRLRTEARVVYQGNAGINIPLAVSGFIYPENDTSGLELDISLSNMKLSLLQPYLVALTSRMGGLVSGDLKLRGSSSRPLLSGTLTARRAFILIDYLNEEYSFTHDIIVNPEGFEVFGLELFDASGQKAVCDGGIYHKNFRDLSVNFRVKPEKFSVLNTTLAQNELFYGKGKATGTARFTGPLDDLLMEIRATTDKGSRIHIPISYDAEVSERGYITFVDPGAVEEKEKSSEQTISGLRMDFELNATPEADVEISLPSRMGLIQGKGRGNLRFNIDTRGDFNMYGDYEISEGFFDMTLQNLLSRRFELRKGGTIRWNGDPYAADLSIAAVYRVRASLQGLIPGGDSSAVYRQRVPVNCIIRLSDDLLSPRIRFAFELPESSEEVNRIVFSQIDTTNEALMSRQMISLLVLNSFISEAGTGSLASGVSASSFELLSMQLSNWLSQISQDFDIGVHYRPGDEMTNEELELALTTQVLNDRVLINGNVGIAGDRNTANASSLVGDVQVEVKLTEDGRFRVKAFNKSNYVDLLDTRAPYTQGVGVFYRKEFDDLEEVFKPRRRPK